MFPGWGFARRKGKMAKRSRDFFRDLKHSLGLSETNRLLVLQFGADCYRAGYRAALEKKR